MAKAKKAPASAPQMPREDEEISTAGLDGMGTDEEQEDDVISELRSLGAGDGYRYTVSRVARKPGESGGYCAQYSAGDLSLDNIREQFGGGKYRIRVIDERGQYAGNRTVEIVDLPKAAAPPAPVPAVVPQGADLNGIAAIIAAMRPQVAPDAGESGTMKLILAMVQQQGTMFQAMMSAQKSDAPSLTDLLALINASNKGKAGADDAVSMLLKGMELGKELGGGESSMLDVAREGIHALVPLLEQERANKAAQPATPALPAPAPTGGAPGAVSTTQAAQQPQGESVSIMQQINWLRAQLQALVVQASRGKNPELYAEVMLDNLPEFITAEEIHARLSAPGAVEQLAQLDGRVRQYAQWFEEFRVALLELLADSGEEEPGPGAPPGVGTTDGASTT
jgi:hypothetical protein